MADVMTAVEVLEGIKSPCIGPPRGGQSVAVAGYPHLRSVFYFGAAAGGVCKTSDPRLTWENIIDGQLQTSSVGALAVSPSHDAGRVFDSIRVRLRQLVNNMQSDQPTDRA